MKVCTVFVLLMPAILQADSNWPQFRGSGATGTAEHPGLPDRWSTTENVAWSVPVPGRGWSSPIVWGGKIFLTTAINEGTYEKPKKGLYLGGERKEPVPYKHRWALFCLDLESGNVLWQRTCSEGKPGNPIHIKNSYASETPVTDGERVYAYFGNVGLFAFDLEGRKVWDRKWDAVPIRNNWGTAASPALQGDLLFILNDNDRSSFLEALDRRTGKTRWRVDRDEKSNWATPFVWKNEMRAEIVTAGTGKVRSYGLDGKLLWELRGMSAITIATPYSAHGLLYVTSGFVMDRNKPIYAIRPGASGDISLKGGEGSNRYIAWSHPGAAPYNPSTLVYGDYLYSLLDLGFLNCYEARTGKEVYFRKRLGRGAGFTSSPWAYNGKVFCLNENGDTLVVQAGPEFKVLHTNGLDEMCMATPAITGDSLLIRTFSRLYRIRKAER